MTAAKSGLTADDRLAMKKVRDDAARKEADAIRKEARALSSRPSMSLALWRRRGSEAEADDRREGHVGPISRDDIASALAAHHSSDLEELPEGERVAALDAMVDGYTDGWCQYSVLLAADVPAWEAGRDVAWTTVEIGYLHRGGSDAALDHARTRAESLGRGHVGYGCGREHEHVGLGYLGAETLDAAAQVRR